jgi:hypothetical protein
MAHEMAKNQPNQLSKFRRWQRRAPELTRHMSEYVEAQLLPQCINHGFMLTDVFLGDRENPVSANEIYLEKRLGDTVDYIDVTFAKYGLPRFQVGFARRRATGKCEFLRRGNLVAGGNQYYHFWGKPWWIPLGFWSDHCSRRAVEEVAGLLGQAFRFLETGERGPNISKQI